MKHARETTGESAGQGRWRTATFGLALAALGLCLAFAGCSKIVKAPAAAKGVLVPARTLRAGGTGFVASPGSLPSVEEELWVIARPKDGAVISDDETPGSGAMLTRTSAGKEVPLPLKHTEVEARISGYIASVHVTQEFLNPYDGKIEAVYVFPMPHNAAVNEFLMIIGERRIRGIIREREDAERIYADAKSQGYVASLLTQERPNIFTQSVANIEPGKRVDVRITYFHTLAYDDGWYEFVFPMVVGPRFNPPGSTDGVGAVPRGAHRTSSQRTEVQYLKPGERSGHDIALAVDVAAGVAIEEVVCRSHDTVQEAPTPERLRISLSSRDRIPNKDFVLRYRVAGDRIKSQLLTHRDERGGFFTLMIFPPEDLDGLPRQPMEMVFVLDCSGSMNGRPLEQAKAAIREALKHLKASDTFQIIRFSNDASRLGSEPLPATPANLRAGLEYLAGLNSEGGTMMIHGIRAALDFPHDPERLRFVSFLTDGYIGNEVEILDEVQRRLGASRIFSFGVGTAVNRYLLEHLAKLGRGAVAYLGANDDGAVIMNRFFERISHPAMTDVRVDWSGWRVTELFPKRAPDLFVGRPVTLTGRFTGSLPSRIRVSGEVGGERATATIPVEPEAVETGCPALPAVWARMKLADLADASVLDNHGELMDDIKGVALDYGLLSAFTAFVAVDASRRTEGRQGTTVPVAVPVPDGVRYDTTVADERGE